MIFYEEGLLGRSDSYFKVFCIQLLDIRLFHTAIILRNPYFHTSRNISYKNNFFLKFSVFSPNMC